VDADSRRIRITNYSPNTWCERSWGTAELQRVMYVFILLTLLPEAANCRETGSHKSCCTCGVFADMLVHVRKHTQPENVAVATKPPPSSLCL